MEGLKTKKEDFIIFLFYPCVTLLPCSRFALVLLFKRGGMGKKPN